VFYLKVWKKTVSNYLCSSIGYQCEEHNNPADFFLDVINGDSTALASNASASDEGLSQSRNPTILLLTKICCINQYVWKEKISNKAASYFISHNFHLNCHYCFNLYVSLKRQSCYEYLLNA